MSNYNLFYRAAILFDDILRNDSYNVNITQNKGN